MQEGRIVKLLCVYAAVTVSAADFSGRKLLQSPAPAASSAAAAAGGGGDYAAAAAAAAGGAAAAAAAAGTPTT